MADTVTVDNDFARFGSKSYAINKINSVEVRERQPHGKAGAIICGILGFLILLGFFGTLASPTGPSGEVFLMGVIFVALAVWQWRRSKIREYHLFLMTSSSETQAFITRDEPEVSVLRQQIEAAMTVHSRSSAAI